MCSWSWISIFLLAACLCTVESSGSREGILLNFTLREIAASSDVIGRKTFGRGASWDDYNQDGRPDLLVCNSMGVTLLYRNNGDGTFTDVARDVKIPQLAEPIFGATWVDYDNDGDKDLYFPIGAEIGDDDNRASENRLLRNDLNTSGRFTDVTEAANASGGRRRSWSAAWADFDNDGFLDVYITNTKDPNVLLRNRGDGTFEDVSTAAGVDDTGNGRFSTWLDYNLDGRLDIFVANVRGPERLYCNNGDGTFTEVAAEAGLEELSTYTWVPIAEDFNHDGWPDLYIVSWNRPNTADPAVVCLNRGDGTFVKQPVDLGASAAGRSMSVQTGDINNDGHMDIVVGNGGPDGPDLNFLYLNAFNLQTNTLRFVDASDASGLTKVPPGRSHGIGLADFDHDGDLDIYINNGGPAARPTSGEVNYFFRNDGAEVNHWLILRLVGTRSNRDAVGARVKVVSAGLTQYLSVKGGSGFNSSNEPFLRIGLGSALQADTVEIHWPSGLVQTLVDVPARADMTLTESGQARPWRAPSRATTQEIQRSDEAAARSVSFSLQCACCSYGEN